MVPQLRSSAMRAVGMVGILSLPAFFAAGVQAATINANPSNYQGLVSGLKPGDTLNLAAGTYPRLFLSGINGAPSAWITIQGPGSGSPAMITIDPSNPG